MSPDEWNRIKLQLFGPGEWMEEPDELDFQYLGFDCRLRRNQMGSWCGYVKVPEDHVYHGKTWDDLDIGVHGGITFCEKLEDGYWIGFDCAHCYDISPVLDKAFGNCFADVVYRNMDYCMNECKKMVDQLKERYGKRIENRTS